MPSRKHVKSGLFATMNTRSGRARVGYDPLTRRIVYTAGQFRRAEEDYWRNQSGGAGNVLPPNQPMTPGSAFSTVTGGRAAAGLAPIPTQTFAGGIPQPLSPPNVSPGTTRPAAPTTAPSPTVPLSPPNASLGPVNRPDAFTGYTAGQLRGFDTTTRAQGSPAQFRQTDQAHPVPARNAGPNRYAAFPENFSPVYSDPAIPASSDPTVVVMQAVADTIATSGQLTAGTIGAGGPTGIEGGTDWSGHPWITPTIADIFTAEGITPAQVDRYPSYTATDFLELFDLGLITVDPQTGHVTVPRFLGQAGGEWVLGQGGPTPVRTGTNRVELADPDAFSDKLVTYVVPQYREGEERAALGMESVFVPLLEEAGVLKAADYRKNPEETYLEAVRQVLTFANRQGLTFDEALSTALMFSPVTTVRSWDPSMRALMVDYMDDNGFIGDKQATPDEVAAGLRLLIDDATRQGVTYMDLVQRSLDDGWAPTARAAGGTGGGGVTRNRGDIEAVVNKLAQQVLGRRLPAHVLSQFVDVYNETLSRGATQNEAGDAAEAALVGAFPDETTATQVTSVLAFLKKKAGG